MRGRYLSGIAVLVLATAIISVSRADEKQPPPVKAVNPAAAKLIDKLTEVAEVDTGYNPFVAGSAFAPLSGSEQVTVMVLGQKSARSDTFRELVKLGATAVPDLVAHLNDKRPTRITVGGFGLLLNKEEKDDKPRTYTLKVGDLCYVALGQIVNRNYAAVSYIPSAIVSVDTPTRDPKMCDELKKDWGELTADKHRMSLLKDCEGKGNVDTRTGAFIRLGWYYPDALEAPAMKFLARSPYDEGASYHFVRDHLYKKTDAHKRRELFDAYVKKTGEAARDGIREMLYEDLATLEAVEAKRREPNSSGELPRQLLIELYAAPKTVKAKDKPTPESISQNHFVEVIEYGLIYDRRPKIDLTVLNLLTKTSSILIAKACVKRLVGRGFDAEIEASFRRHENDFGEYGKEIFEKFLPKAGWTPLHVAVSEGQPERLAELLREGAKVNARAKDGRTALHLAAAEGNTHAIKVLLDAGADPKATDSKGQTPVSVASFEGNAETVRQLVTGGGPISDILVAATLGKTEEMAAFLRKDKNALRATDRAGLTPLHRAAAEGQVKVMQQLLDAGAEVDSHNNEEGCTPLHLAAAYGRADGCALLIRRKAKVDQPLAGSRKQPILLAALYGRLDVVKLLIEKGAHVDARDADNNTPLLHAAQQGHLAVVQWLVGHKADINADNDRGETPVSLAEQNGHKEVVAFLLKNGAKKSPRD